MVGTGKLALLVRVVVGGFFIFAGFVKIIDPMAFAFQVDHYQLLPWTASALLALYLPWLEIVSGLALLWQPWARAAAWIILALLVVFVLALAAAWFRGLDISCGCFGNDGGSGAIPLTILRDLVMIGGILQVLRNHR